MKQKRYCAAVMWKWARAGFALLEERMGGNRRFCISYLRSIALLAEYDGNVEQAIAQLHQAAAFAKEIGVPRECWQI